MAKKTLTEKLPKEVTQGTEEESVLVTLSGSVNGRFQVENNQAFVKPSELTENEKFMVINGKTYIHVTVPSHSYIL